MEVTLEFCFEGYLCLVLHCAVRSLVIIYLVLGFLGTESLVPLPLQYRL